MDDNISTQNHKINSRSKSTVDGSFLQNSAKHKLKILTVPLVFRDYVNKIEDRFPDIKAVVPANSMRNQKFHIGIFQRKYNWIDILTKNRYEEDVYVKLTNTALKNYFLFSKEISHTKGFTELDGTKTKRV